MSSIWYSACAYIALFCVASANASVENKSMTNAVMEDWSGIYHKSLFAYSQGKYSEAYNMIEKAVRNYKPGYNVHRCLELMRVSFLKMHECDTSLIFRSEHDMNTKALEALKKLESQGAKTDIDIVLIASLKSIPYYYKPSEELLSDLVEGNSLWRDWAYWKRYDLVSMQLAPLRRNEDSMGVIEVKDPETGKITKYLVENRKPGVSYKGRSALAYVKKNPESYMSKQMQFDILHADAAKVVMHMDNIQQYAKAYNQYYLDEHAVAGISELRSKFHSTMNSMPEKVDNFMLAEDDIDGCIKDGRIDVMYISEYFHAYVELNGKDSLSTDIREWINTVKRVNINPGGGTDTGW